MVMIVAMFGKFQKGFKTLHHKCTESSYDNPLAAWPTMATLACANQLESSGKGRIYSRTPATGTYANQ
jgi:hypothetical protein